MRQNTRLNKTILSIGMGPATSVCVFPFIYRTIQESFPEIYVSQVEMSCNESLNALRQGGLDLHLNVYNKEEGPARNPEFESISLFDSELVFCLPKNHPLAEKDYLTNEDIKNEPLVSRDLDSGKSSPMVDFFLPHHEQGNIRFHSNNLSTIRSMIINNMAYACVLKGTFRSDPLIVEKPFLPALVYSVCIEYNARISHDPVFYKIVNHLRDMDKSVFIY